MTPYVYVETVAALDDLVQQLLAQPRLTLSLDTETTGLDPLARASRVLLCQIGAPDGSVWVINAAKLDLRPLAPVLRGGRVVVLQNAKFDVRWLFAKYGLRIGALFDTALAELLLNAGIAGVPGQRRKAASLKSLAARYLGITLDKAVRSEFIGYEGCEFSAAQLQYAADDIPLLFAIKAQQAVELEMAGLVETARLEFQSVYPVARMELNGLGIDRPAYEAVIAAARVRQGETAAVCRAYLRKRDLFMNLFDEVAINLDSPKQIREVFQLLDHPLPDTEEKTLKKSGHPFAKLLLEYREYETQVSTFGEPVLNQIHPVTGRVHAEFDQLGTDSGRFAASKPNLQQIPREGKFRGCFIPAPGNLMCVADWSQFELRILCFFAKDRAMLAAFEAGRDLHSDTAARMYGLAYETVTKEHPARADAKILNFALSYGMGPTSLADDLGCSVEEAKAKMGLYFDSYPEVARYLKAAAAEGVRKMETRTVAGRRRRFHPPEAGPDYRRKIASIERQAKNTPIQGSNADALKRAMIAVQRRLDEAGWAPGIVACVHDEIVLEVGEKDAPAAAAMLAEEMKKAGSFYLPGVPVKAEVSVADRWAK